MAEEQTGSESGNGSSDLQGTTNAAEGSQQIDPNDYRARIESGGEFAWNENQKFQSQVGKAFGKLKTAEAAIRAAELVGNGDVEAGGRLLGDVAGFYSKVFSDPQMAPLVSNWLQTGKVEIPGSSNDDDDWDDPRDKALRELRSGLERVSLRTARSEMMGHIESFFEKDELGKILTQEERGGVLDALTHNIDQWSKTPAGRQQIDNLTSGTIELVALKHLKDQGILKKVSERLARQKADERESASTERPSGVSTTGAGLSEHYDARPGSKEFTLEVVKEARRRFV